jgi:hypothetical protein
MTKKAPDLQEQADKVAAEFIELVDSLSTDPEIAKEALVTMELLLGGLKKANGLISLSRRVAFSVLRPALPKLNQFLQWAGKNSGKALEFLAKVMENQHG